LPDFFAQCLNLVTIWILRLYSAAEQQGTYPWHVTRVNLHLSSP
jgi:hypothetical protein